jgi:hypothetical protein
MAKLIPTRSSVAGRMNSGERRFADRLESLLEDDYLCWYDVPVGRKALHPDFLILHPRRGMLVVEVKDWKLSTIQKIDKLEATLVIDGRLTRKANPLEQARSYAHAVNRLLESDPALVGPPGTPYQGKLAFPMGHGVVLANISRKEFLSTDLGQVIPSERVICRDEMTESADAEAFQRRLWGMFGVTFRCLLTLPQIERIRWHLFPEIRISQGALAFEPTSSDETPAIPDVVRVMDLQQEQLARSMGNGHRVIHGVAGSGKTMILGYRAQYLAQVLQKPILVLCYNAALAVRLDHLIVERGLSAKVHVRSFHSWCFEQIKLYHLPRPEGQGDELFKRLVEAVIRGVDRAQVPRSQYGAVLIDEGHDFEPEWLKLIVQMVDPESNSLLVLYDDAQNINRRKSRLAFSFAEVGIQARGRTTILKLNYRNTAEIMAVACEFARELLSRKDAEEDGVPLVAPESAGSHGKAPEIKSLPGYEEEIRYIVDRLKGFHDAGTRWKDMAVLFRKHHQGERVAEQLKRAEIPFDLLDWKRRARAFRPAIDSVKVMSMHSSKGLEFPVVLIPCLDGMPAANEEVTVEAKLLYVAMTRATERLVMTHHAGSLFVERLRESLRVHQSA